MCSVQKIIQSWHFHFITWWILIFKWCYIFSAKGSCCCAVPWAEITNEQAQGGREVTHLQFIIDKQKKCYKMFTVEVMYSI